MLMQAEDLACSLLPRTQTGGVPTTNSSFIGKDKEIVVSRKLSWSSQLERKNQASNLVATLNHFLPAVFAPLDVLLMIFEDAMADGDLTTLCRLGQVCHTWRDIILATPSLWSKTLRLDMNQVCVVELLKRTGDVPLDIRIKYDTVEPEKTSRLTPNLLFIASHFWRFSSFDVEAPSGLLIDFFQDMFDDVEVNIYEAAYLRQLSIRGSCPIVFSVDLPDELVGLVAPKLEQIVLEGCTFQWERLRLGLLNPRSSITTLHLSNITRQSRPTLSDLFGVLITHPGLKSLQLCDALRSERLAPDAASTISLDSLLSFTLKTSFEICVDFMCSALMPSLQRLCIDVRSTVTPQQIPVLMAGIRRVFPFVDCSFMGIEHRLNQFHFTSVNCMEVPSEVTIPWSLPANQVLDEHAISILLRELSEMKPLWTVKHMVIKLGRELHAEVTAEAWGVFLKKFPGIVHLDLGELPPILLLGKLYHDAAGYAGCKPSRKRSNKDLLVPSLSAIQHKGSREASLLVQMIGEVRESVGKPFQARLDDIADEDILCLVLQHWLQEGEGVESNDIPW